MRLPQVTMATEGCGSRRGQAFLARAEAMLAHDAAALAVLDPHTPKPEHFLALRGVDAGALRAWCDRDTTRDALSRAARAAWTDADAATLAESLFGHPGVAQVLPASLTGNRVWLLAIGRQAGGFDHADRVRAALLLRREQLTLDAPREPGLGRLLLDEHNTLIHADPVTEAELELADEGPAPFAARLRAVIAQRWPEGTGGQPHDLTLDLHGRARWIRIDEGSPAEDIGSQLCIELRPTEPDDPPAVELVDDPRIAEAVAFLDDHYHEAPSLNDVAAQVHVSPFHFHRLFSRSVGLSPKHYLLRVQMRIAKWRLRTTPQPVHLVASSTGFASHGHFTATFHRLIGQSPTEYRESQILPLASE